VGAASLVTESSLGAILTDREPRAGGAGA
jgi:hypothetical protein